MPAGAMKQTHPEPLLQQSNTPAQLGFGHVQRPTGRSESTVLNHLGEVVQRVEIFDDRSPNRTLRLIFAV
jgi:hypothetical protein